MKRRKKKNSLVKVVRNNKGRIVKAISRVWGNESDDLAYSDFDYAFDGYDCGYIEHSMKSNSQSKGYRAAILDMMN